MTVARLRREMPPMEKIQWIAYFKLEKESRKTDDCVRVAGANMKRMRG